MGSFEKLGILVIVVIIVMILAVAIYQWGAGAGEMDNALAVEFAEDVPPLIVDFDATPPVVDVVRPEPGSDTSWPGGVPRRHTIRPNDTLWDLVVGEWGLRESFVPVLRAANPGLDMQRLKPGDTITVPDPAGHLRGEAGSRREPVAPATVSYEIKVGDNLENIARTHLGARSRWREILALNPGLDDRRLRPGKVILLPAK